MKVMAAIHSLGGKVKEVELIEKRGDNEYIVEYDGVKCTAIFNPFVGIYYADDKYGRLE